MLDMNSASMPIGTPNISGSRHSVDGSGHTAAACAARTAHLGAVRAVVVSVTDGTEPEAPAIASERRVKNRRNRVIQVLSRGSDDDAARF
jgi:hypothetical protein